MQVIGIKCPACEDSQPPIELTELTYDCSTRKYSISMVCAWCELPSLLACPAGLVLTFVNNGVRLPPLPEDEPTTFAENVLANEPVDFDQELRNLFGNSDPES